MSRLIEPVVARTIARRVGGVARIPRVEYRVLEEALATSVGQSSAQVQRVSGIPETGPVRWAMVDRGAWAEVNIRSMNDLLGPLADRIGARVDGLPSAVRIAQRGVLSIEVGILLGYVSRRVLGQYDLFSAGPEAKPSRRPGAGASLYFVGPNLLEMERRFGFVREDFLLWVSLHEVTHRFQFEGVPWLRAHFLNLISEWTGALNIDARGLAKRFGTAARKLANKDLPAEERHPIYLLADEEQRALLDRLQALMAVVEGHGNWVMDTAGAVTIPTFGRMREVFQGRRRSQNIVQRVVSNVLGLEMKMRQYELGQSFCDAVALRAGPEALQRLWLGPEHLPTIGELRAPELWLERVAA